MEPGFINDDQMGENEARTAEETADQALLLAIASAMEVISVDTDWDGAMTVSDRARELADGALSLIAGINGLCQAGAVS